MRARDAAVSDVSLALKNADSAMRTTMATMMMAMLAVMGAWQASELRFWCAAIAARDRAQPGELKGRDPSTVPIAER